MTTVNIDADKSPSTSAGAPGVRPGLNAVTAEFTALLDDLASRTDNRFLLAVGPSGSGRTTLLEHVSAQCRPDQFVGIGRLAHSTDVRAALGDAVGQVLAQILSQRPGSRDAREAAQGAARFSTAALPHLEGYATEVRPAIGEDLLSDFVQLCRLVNLVLDGLPGRSALILVDDIDIVSPADRHALVDMVRVTRANGLFIGLGATATDADDTTTDVAAMRTVEIPALSAADVAYFADGLGLTGRLTADGIEAARSWSGASASALLELLAAAASHGDAIDRASIEHLTTPQAPAEPAMAEVPGHAGEASPPSPLPSLSGTARRYLVALVRLGPEATARSVAQALGDNSRFGAEGSAFAPVLGDLVARGLVQADARGHLSLADPGHAATLLAEA